MRQEESRAGDDARGPGVQGGAGVGAGGDSAGEEHRTLAGRRQGVGQEVQSRHGSDEVAAGLASLSDQTVGAPGGRRARLLRGTDHHKHKDPGIAKVLDEPALFAECQHDGVHASIDADPDVVATDEGHQEIYRDGATRRVFAHKIDRRAQPAGRGETDCSQTTRPGDRCRQ